MADNRVIIGGTTKAEFPELGLVGVPARVDTGAKTSALWVTNVVEKDNKLYFTLFGPESEWFTGKQCCVQRYSQRIVVSSNGAKQERYVIRLLIKLGDRSIRASFTLANRSSQVYPILVGRNILRGKFIVDVKLGDPTAQILKRNDKAIPGES